MAGFDLTPPTVIPPALDPLAQSHEADDLEAELQSAFIEVFEDMLRAAERRLNSYGVPHRAEFATIERFVKQDGLAMERRTSAEAFMAQLFRAWRARNPRRGTAFLRHYLQLLWPGQWTLEQLWQDPALPYPVGANGTEAPGKFLTSRLRLLFQDDALFSVDEVNRLSGSFRAVLPARMVLDIRVAAGAESFMRAGNVVDDLFYDGLEGAAVMT
jgi:hypothetical protein